MYYNQEAELRTLYQVYSSQIEFSKTQLWRVVNYAIWAIAAIIGLSKSFDESYKWATLFPAAIIAVLFICLYNMFKCWRSMRSGRRQYISIADELSSTFRRILEYQVKYQVGQGGTFPRNYGSSVYDAWIVVPLILVLCFGSYFAYRHLAARAGICFWQRPCRENLPSQATLLFCSLAFLIYLFRPYFRCIPGLRWIDRHILRYILTGFGEVLAAWGECLEKWRNKRCNYRT